MKIVYVQKKDVMKIVYVQKKDDGISWTPTHMQRWVEKNQYE